MSPEEDRTSIDPEAEADRLYGLPLEDFVPARDALAKRLRSGGDRAAADRVKKLGKPSVAAWGVNQVVRSQPRAARDLLEAGDTLRGAQEELVAGRGAAAGVREASEAEREAVASLVEAARGLLTGDGRALAPAALERIEQTLHAATVDDEARTEVAAGRVTRERQAVGLGPLLGGMAAPGPAAREAAPARSRAELKAAREQQRTSRRALEAAEDALDEAEADREQAENRLAEAERARAEAAEAQEDAVRRVREAEQALARARDDLRAADERLGGG